MRRSYARIALLPVGLLIAFLAFVNAASGVGTLPFATMGHGGWFGLNGHVLSLLGDSGFKEELTRHEAEVRRGELPRLSDRLMATARAAYAVNPLDAAALRTIALGSLLQTDKDRARQLMRTAAQISKRDSMIDLWLAQDYGELGDTDAMLASFDQALRTSTSVRATMMKPVVETLADPASFAPLARLLKLHPEWEADFWRQFVSNPVGIDNSATFLTASGISLDSVPDGARQILYANLKRAKKFEVLFRLAALDPDIKANADALADGRFVTVDQGDPLGWVLYSKGTAAAHVIPDSGVLEIDAQPGSFGTAAERTVKFGAAQTLAIRLAEPMPDNATLTLTAECADDAKTRLAEIRLENGGKEGRLPIATGDCGYGTLRLSFAVDEGRSAALLHVAGITLRGS
jgi:hypothetical protein